MAVTYKLIYFNVTGLAEPIRYLFAYGEIPYEDCRLEYEQWKKYKPSTPFGQLPVLEINGKLYNQTASICRHFAKKLGLVGKTSWDTFQTDIIVDTINDFRLNYAAYFHLETEEEKKSQLLDIKNIHNPYYLSKFEEVLQKNGGYFVNHQLTWADIFFAALSDLWIKTLKEPILDFYPMLNNLKNEIDSLPKIKAYLDKRPKTLY